MSSTTQPKDFSDLYTDLMNRVRASTAQTTNVVIAKRYINAALLDMHIGSFERFPWAEREAVLVTHPKYTTGTIVFNIGTATITGTSTVWTTANSLQQDNARVGGKILVSGETEPYEIITVASASVLSTKDIRIGASVSGSEFTYFEDEYDLASDFLRPLDAQRFSPSPTPINLIGRNEFRKRHPRNIILNKPVLGSIIDAAPRLTNAPRRRLRLFPAPDIAYRIPYAYVTNLLATDTSGTGLTQLSSDDDEPIVPLRYRLAIVLHATWNWYRDREDDVARAREARNDYTELLSRIRSDTEVGQNRPRLMPRHTGTRRRARRPWRGTSGTGRFDMGDFDYGGN